MAAGWCTYGTTTDAVNCTTISGAQPGLFFGAEDVILNGDSGGPWWIPTKGLIGKTRGGVSQHLQIFNAPITEGKERSAITALNLDSLDYLQ